MTDFTDAPNFTSWMSSSGECGTKCHEISVATIWRNLLLNAAGLTPVLDGDGPANREGGVAVVVVDALRFLGLVE